MDRTRWIALGGSHSVDCNRWIAIGGLQSVEVKKSQSQESQRTQRVKRTKKSQEEPKPRKPKEPKSQESQEESRRAKAKRAKVADIEFRECGARQEKCSDQPRVMCSLSREGADSAAVVAADGRAGGDADGREHDNLKCPPSNSTIWSTDCELRR